MLNDILLYTGSIIIFIWGAAHLYPTKDVVTAFGDISLDNRRIITMEWIAEGLALCFIGILVFLTTLLGWSREPSARIVYFASTAMLVVLAVLSQMTGARTSVMPMRLCPYIKTAVAIMFFLGIVL